MGQAFIYGKGGGGLKTPDTATGKLTGYAEEDFSKNDLVFGEPGYLYSEEHTYPVNLTWTGNSSGEVYGSMAFSATADGSDMYFAVYDPDRYTYRIGVYRWNGSGWTELSFPSEPAWFTGGRFPRNGQMRAVPKDNSTVVFGFLANYVSGYIEGFQVTGDTITLMNSITTDADFDNYDSAFNMHYQPSNGRVSWYISAGSDADTGDDLGWGIVSGTSWAFGGKYSGYSSNHYPNCSGFYDESSGRYWLIGSKGSSTGEVQIGYSTGGNPSSYSALNIANYVRGGFAYVDDGNEHLIFCATTSHTTLLRCAYGGTSVTVKYQGWITGDFGTVKYNGMDATHYNGYYFMAKYGKIFYTNDLASSAWSIINYQSDLGYIPYYHRFVQTDDGKLRLAVNYYDTADTNTYYKILEIENIPSFSSTQDTTHTMIGLGQEDVTTGNQFKVTVLN